MIRRISIKTEEAFLAFVEEQINELNAQMHDNINYENLKLYDITLKLSNHTSILNTLIGYHEYALIQLGKAEEDFDDWYATRYLEQRKKVNVLDLTAQKWASAKELEAMVRTEHKDEYKEKKEELEIMRKNVNFIERLIKSWEGQHFNLSRIAKNLEVEVLGLRNPSPLREY